MNIGVLGGTFDPIHNGHLMMAEEARARLGLAEVLFVPAGRPWLKVDSPVSAAEHRVQMVRLAIAGKPYFKLSTVEVERAGPSYTVDTITGLRAQLGDEDEIFFILGWDALAQFPQWREPSRIMEMCRLVAVCRPGCSLPDLDSLEAVVPGSSRGVVVLDKPEAAIDSTEIRDRVARGLSVRHLVPEPVDDYIRRHKLYVTQLRG
jgi:nicotinate-nucleotide adenylyltransferase